MITECDPATVAVDGAGMVSFSCPHLRIGGYWTPDAARAVIMDYLDLHDHFGPPECVAELRARYGDGEDAG